MFWSNLDGGVLLVHILIWYLLDVLVSMVDIVEENLRRLHHDHRFHHNRGHRLLAVAMVPNTILNDDDCFRCLCAASSSCQINARCRIIEPDKYLCGPFRLHESYWRQASSSMMTTATDDTDPFENPLQFELCSLDLYCSIRTVHRFLRDYLQNCSKLFRIMVISKSRKLQCSLLALVHYQAIYGQEDEDEDDLKPILLKWNKCIDLNSHQNISKEILLMQQVFPSTRYDDDYWRHFQQCSSLYL